MIDAKIFTATRYEHNAVLNTLNPESLLCVSLADYKNLATETEELREWQRKIRADYVCPDCAATTAERDALHRTLETPPGCARAGQVYMHCLACEVDGLKTRVEILTEENDRLKNQIAGMVPRFLP